MLKWMATSADTTFVRTEVIDIVCPPSIELMATPVTNRNAACLWLLVS